MELLTISKTLGKTSLLQIYNQNEDTRQITETLKIIKKNNWTPTRNEESGQYKNH
jgi:hypothetical protein